MIDDASWLDGDDEEEETAAISPEMDAVVTPFVKYVRELAEEAVTGGRKPQPGDDVLAEIKSRSVKA